MNLKDPDSQNGTGFVGDNSTSEHPFAHEPVPWLQSELSQRNCVELIQIDAAIQASKTR